MTRFARAKGSKASNERVPNDATPWDLLKPCPEMKNKGEESQKRVKSARQLLAEKDSLLYSDNIGNVNNEWAEFTNDKSSKRKVQDLGKQKEKVSTREVEVESDIGQKRERVEDSVTEERIKKQKKKKNDTDNVTMNKDVEINSDVAPRKKNKIKRNDTDNVTVNKDVEINSDVSVVKKDKKKENECTVNEVNAEQDNKANSKKKKKKERKEKKDNKPDPEVEQDESKTPNDEEKSTTNNQRLSKRQKRNLKMKNKNINANANESKTDIEAEGRNKDTQNDSDGLPNRPNNFNNNQNQYGKRKFENSRQPPKRKLPKIRDDKIHKRRKPDEGSVKMTINGIEVEIVKYDGFPVRKEDADRLTDLRKQMVMKGIPKNEIAAAMKLERRKAEKALARIKKCVCFHCRKSGHNLSDCPELGSEQAATGICFKCGSTEHTHFQCKVAKATEYRYATCFICREQGHISKQCPDNPKGIYPQGGACNICGDVTHLKKDCPDLVKEKEEAHITLDTIANNNLESLEEDAKAVSRASNENSKKSKVVKF